MQAVLANAVTALANRDADLLDFEATLRTELVAQGCNEIQAQLLVEYLPAACGRSFVRELGAIPSDTYQRALPNGGWSEQQSFADDPLWLQVEQFAERLRTTSEFSRKQFSLLAQHSAEVSTVNNAMKSGMTLENLKGAVFASVFMTPLPDAAREDVPAPKRAGLLARLRTLFGAR